MADRRTVTLSKITSSWRVQLPAEIRRILNKRDKKNFKVGDKVAFIVDVDGRVIIERV